jgi:hypothetical protein
MQTVAFEPHIPLALWAPLAVAAVVLVGLYARASRARLSRGRWLTGTALMALGVAVPLVLLLNPIWLDRIPPPEGKPRLVVLLDRSASMATVDVGARQSRFDIARAAVRSLNEGLAEQFDVQLRAFADDVTATSLEQLDSLQADGEDSDLAAAIQLACEGESLPGQAILLLSDGIHNAPGGTARLREALARAKAMAAPVLAYTLGGDAEVNDLRLAIRNPQELAFVGQKVPVLLELEQKGQLPARVEISLWEHGKPVERREVELRDGRGEAAFQVSRDRTGLFAFDVQAAARPGEATTLNNAAAFVLRVVDEPIKVLLLEGKPYWDTKFLVRTLALDTSIELTSIVRLSENRVLERRLPRAAPPADEQSPQPAAPAETWQVHQSPDRVLSDAAALAAYQIVILGRDADVFLNDDSLGQLKKWLISSDGSLVCFRGPPSAQVHERLDQLMPIRWTPARETRHRLRWTDEGRSLHWLPESSADDTLAAMPSLVAAARPGTVKDHATVLATSGNEQDRVPVIAYQLVGNGRVVAIDGAGMWRWAFLPPKHRDRDDVYGTFWRSMMRWLLSNVGMLPRQQFALRPDKVTFDSRDSATATFSLRTDGEAKPVPAIELMGDELTEPRTLTPVPLGEPGQYRVAFGRLPPGRYRARVVGSREDEPGAAAAFEVRGPLKEQLELSAQPATMEVIAQQSGGAALGKLDARVVCDYFAEHQARTRPERFSQTAAWDRWWVLGGAIGLWGVAWGLRRHAGLV